MRAGAERAVALVAAAVLAAAAAGCGKKAPLRLPEDRPVIEAPLPRARVREGRVALEIRVPRHRVFPEREEPWVLARVLREAAGAPADRTEAGAILEGGGFAFGSSLSWSDRELPPGSYVYRVEFRDRVRRRRALSGPVAVSWERIPGTPQGLAAVGGTRSIALSWEPAGDAAAGTRFALYRREPPAAVETPVTPEPLTERRHVDPRVEPGREYCYSVRAVLTVNGVPVEGSSAAEACARAADEPAAPARPADAPP